MIIKKINFFGFFMCDENLIDKWLNARKIEKKGLLITQTFLTIAILYFLVKIFK